MFAPTFLLLSSAISASHQATMRRLDDEDRARRQAMLNRRHTPTQPVVTRAAPKKPEREPGTFSGPVDGEGVDAFFS